MAKNSQNAGYQIDSQFLTPAIPYRGGRVTAERIERALDRLAEIMVQFGDEGRQCLPIYRRLKEELAAYRSMEDDMSEIRERAKRSKDRRAKPPST